MKTTLAENSAGERRPPKSTSGTSDARRDATMRRRSAPITDPRLRDEATTTSMAGNPETRRAQVDAPCPRAVATVTLLFLGLGGCRSYFADTLEVVQRIPLPDSTATILLLDSGERFWVGAPGRITGVDSTGSIVAEVVLPTTSPLDWVAASPARLYFLAGRALGNAALPDRGSSSVVGPQIVSLEVPADAVALDPRDRYVFCTAEYGSLIAHDADTMQPLWGWGAVGGPATAITSTPGGERGYQGSRAEEATSGRQSREKLVCPLKLVK